MPPRTEEPRTSSIAHHGSIPTIKPEISQKEAENIVQSLLEASYFDASTMAPLSPASLAAIARLRSFRPPPFSTWDKLPLSRRAAVLILLFADRRGDLRVVITMRANTLRNYSGHAAFPGGKADTLDESPFEIARREAWEEIGLPRDDSKIPSPFRIEHLCQLPFSLAKTALAVRPCVAFLHSDEYTDRKEASVEETMIPKLDAREVAAVFTASLHNFLKSEDELREGEPVVGQKNDWYDGMWTNWLDTKWRMHNFYVPINNQKVSKPKQRAGGQAAIAEQNEEDDSEEVQRYRVWGMTARILVETARLAFEEDPEFEFNSHYGDEDLITSLHEMGRLKEKQPGGPDLTDGDILAARKRSRSPTPSKI